MLPKSVLECSSPFQLSTTSEEVLFLYCWPALARTGNATTSRGGQLQRTCLEV